ncbi:MAG: mycofactocin biosynthesis chaperone MftB [Desulfosarcinaceae bacterium]|nr:mycofactocin biosynthesis chaperone MftB [Desulfosarcinaceae bacterium]
MRETGFRLAAGVQVRREVFGLLFYDYRGPRLYFVPSRDLLPAAFFDGRQTVADLLERLPTVAASTREQVRSQLLRLLNTLREKGLIHGE